jgi:hypothetical protein
MKLIYSLLILLLTSCGVHWQYTTLNHAAQVDSIYNSPKVDTINSLSDLKYKLRTDFSFRWDFAQYAMNQPYSWYWNNPRLDGIWRPYNRFDIYFYSNWFWTDWAYDYPYNSYFGWNSWHRPWNYYNWYRPYRPWNWGHNWYQGPYTNTSYNIVYNASRRGALTTNVNRISNNISNRLTVNRNKPRVNVNKPLNLPVINNNSRPRINNNKPVIINNNNYRPVINNNYRPSNNSRPSYSPSSTIRTAPSNNSRSGNNNISRGNSRGKN